MTIGLALDLWNEHRRFDRDFFRTLFEDPKFSTPGRAGTKNGSVTWTGATGGPYLNPWTGQLLNTNYLIWSQQFDAAAWTKTNITLTTQTAETMAPDGTQTATKVLATAGAATTFGAGVVMAGAVVTFSIFVKRGSGDTDANRFKVRNNTTATDLLVVTFNHVTGAITYATGSTGASAYDVGNGWWRVVLTVSSGITSGNSITGFACFDGAAETANEFAYIWGAQLELGDQATDYIPTLGAAQGAPCYVRRAMPGFTVPRIPAVVWNGSKYVLDAPFRHDFRIGQNMLVNSAWDGAVAGSPGTAPTGWTMLAVNGTLTPLGAGALSFAVTVAGNRHIIGQTVTVAANTSYFASAKVSAASGNVVIQEMITATAVPAGAAISYYINGVKVAIGTLVSAGDIIGCLIAVAGTAGTAVIRVGLSVNGVLSPVSSITLTEPQVEVGTVRSVYTPTTTAAINAVVCEPVKSTEDEVYVEWHAQGARTNLVPAMSSGSGTSVTLIGMTRTAVENTATSSHSVISASDMTLADATTYTLRVKARRVVGSRFATVRVYSAGGANDIRLYFNFTTGVASVVGNGTCSASGLTYTTTADGSLLASVSLVSSAWGGNATARVYMSEVANSIGSYTGDGASSIEWTGLTIEAATFPGVPLGEGVTRTADNIVWNLGNLTSGVAGEIAAAATPYEWSAAEGASTPATVMQYVFRASGATMYRQNTIDVVGRTDGAGQSVTANALSDSSGTSRMVSGAYSSDSLDLYQGMAKKASDVILSPPWVTVPALTIASNLTPANHYHGTVALFLANGRTFTDGERALLANALDGKTQAIAA